jgi:Flp pilus assembly pilin Flp
MAPIAGALRGRLAAVDWVGAIASVAQPSLPSSRGLSERGSGSKTRALILARAKGVWRNMFECLWRDQRGASLIDYAILAALITALIIAGIAVAGSWVQSTWVRLLAMLG